MSLTIESVMNDLAPMLKPARPSKPTECRYCDETDPEQFGRDHRACLPCRRDYAQMRKAFLARCDQFQNALGVLRIINSFPPTGA